MRREWTRGWEWTRGLSSMASSAVLNSLIANLLRSLCGPAVLGALKDPQSSRGLAHQSRSSEPFTSVP